MIFIVTKIFTLRYLLFFHRNETLLAQNVGGKFRPTAIKLIENETKFLFYQRYIERCNSYKKYFTHYLDDSYNQQSYK